MMSAGQATMESVASAALSAAFELQRAASRAEPFAAWATRADRLRRLRHLLRANRATLAAALSDDFGHRSRHETELLEITPLLDGIADSLRHGAAWMRERRHFPGYKYWPGKAALLPQPLGVAGIVVPWNYPLALSLGPLTSAFVAGNRAMLKLSELTPRLAAQMNALVRSAFAVNELQVFEGDADFSRQFCRLPFDHLLFTGSSAVGHQVMHAASDNLTPVTLELGGKSPAIIGPGRVSAHQFDRMVERLVIGKTVNAGQTCIAPDYVFAPRARIAQVIDAAQRATARFYPQLASTPDYTSIISAHHFDRLQALLDDALAGGATAWPLSGAPSDAGVRRFAPVILSEPAPASRVLHEEIFGPLLPVLAYDDLDEALAWIKARPRPLALYLFEHDRRTVAHVLQQTVSGGVSVNDTLVHFGCDALPFGGVGASGMGAYHGEAGFRTFSHVKPVFHQARFNVLRWLHPPFGRTVETLLRMPR
jgi:aldehyde dehydrogenase (NAD+)/coniferyl-aldehyde dehydrogenase